MDRLLTSSYQRSDYLETKVANLTVELENAELEKAKVKIDKDLRHAEAKMVQCEFSEISQYFECIFF